MNMHVDIRAPAFDDSEWTRLTGAANDAYASDRLCEALLLYRDAFHEAEALFAAARSTPSHVPVASIYVISCQNLAEATRSAGEIETSENWSLRAFEHLASAAESPATPLSLRLDCMRDLKLAFFNLIERRREEETFQPEMERYVARGRHVVATVMGVVKQLARIPEKEFLLLDSVTGRPS